jgi:exosortase/archaeosortase family protein
MAAGSDTSLDANVKGLRVTAVTAPRVRTPAVVVLLVAAAAMLALVHRLYQRAEISLAALVFQPSGVRLDGAAHAVYFGLDTDHPLGMRMTPEGTSAFLLVPLLLLASVLVALVPRITGKVVVALGFAALALVVVNQLRILSLVGLVSWLGADTGYLVGHTLLGSLINVVGSLASLVLFGWLVVRRRTGNSSRVT